MMFHFYILIFLLNIEFLFSYHVLHDSIGRWSESLIIAHFDDHWKILSDQKGDSIKQLSISKNNDFNCSKQYLLVDHPNGQNNGAASKGKSSHKTVSTDNLYTNILI